MAFEGTFFLDWPGWAQLSLVLGALFSVVLGLAAAVKVIRWRRTVRLEKEAAEQQAERGEIAQSIRLSEDVPFGIKALEQEPAIEGVWYAGTATPLHVNIPTSKGSSLLSPLRPWHKSTRSSSVSFIPPFDTQEPEETSVEMVPAPPPATMDDIPKPASAPLTKRRKSHSITINYAGPLSRPLTSPNDSEPLPSHPLMSSSGNAQAKLRLRPSPPRSGSNRRLFVIGGRSSPAKIVGAGTKDIEDVIDRMNAHRRLHSAESGQLLPRPQRRTTEVPPTPSDESDSDGHDSTAARAISWPVRSHLHLGRRQPQRAKALTSPDVVPLRAFVEAHPPPKAPPSAWTSRTQGLVNEKLSEIHISTAGSLASPPSLCSNTTLESSPPLSDALSFANTQTRKVNENFEVLPTGTFDRATQVKVFGLWPATVGHGGKGKRRANKLQRRASSRSSGESSRSSSDRKRVSDFGLRFTVN